MKNAIQQMYLQAHNVWVPRWFEIFSDPAGGFYERLDADLKPIDMPRRLVMQCRQIMVYSMADREHYAEKLAEGFSYMRRVYDVNGIPVFNPTERHYDLYALAFILSACAAYRTKEAFAYADSVLEFIQIHFAADVGLYESLDLSLKPRAVQRRQNPHMHLLEGALAMLEATGDMRYRTLADDMVALFFDRFFNGTHLFEFFDADLKNPLTIVEAGHHAEWVWLLDWYKKHAGADPRINAAQERLYAFATVHGIDRQYGGVYNQQNIDGSIVEENKRIWPQMETLRAACIMRDEAVQNHFVTLLQQKYLHADGIWTEELDRHSRSKADWLPGTTPYHVYPVLKASLDSLNEAA